VDLGVTFIKLGQFLSVRRDIVPMELVKELSLLQDQVPPFPYYEAKALVEKELGGKLNNFFLSFDESPIASASIGQVHRAVLKNKEVVAVKIQRAKLEILVKQDIALMHYFVCLTKFLMPNFDWQNWSVLIDEFGKTLFWEMNFLQEGQNADRLRKVLRPFPMIVIPRIFWQYTTKRVITEELRQGTKIDKLDLLSNHNLKRISKCLVEAYLEQVLEHGYFHADPHAGNLAINNDGQIIMYDFGIMGSLSKEQRLGLVNLVLSIAKNDISLFVDAIGALGFIKGKAQTDKASLLKMIEPIWTKCLSPSKNQIDLADLEKEVDLLMLSKNFLLPANLAYLIRMIVTLEAILHNLNPDLNFLRTASPYFQKIMAS
jgi:predicted unusual protein kinase regulating ubiquinone biosynthesis (AarF/ABC1/UbiB family)